MPLPTPVDPVTDPVAPTPVVVPPGRLVTEPVPIVLVLTEPVDPIALPTPELPEIGAWPVVGVAPALGPVAPVAAPVAPPPAVCAIALVDISAASAIMLIGIFIIPFLLKDLG